MLIRHNRGAFGDAIMSIMANSKEMNNMNVPDVTLQPASAPAAIPNGKDTGKRVSETDALKAKIAELEAKLHNAQNQDLRFKVSEKGACSVIGLGRFPTTLYYGQWMRLLSQKNITNLVNFLEANKAKFSTKEE